MLFSSPERNQGRLPRGGDICSASCGTCRSLQAEGAECAESRLHSFTHSFTHLFILYSFHRHFIEHLGEK